MDTYKTVNPVSVTEIVDSRKEFLDYIHNYRGLAIVIIVAIHVSSLVDWGTNLFQQKIILSLFTNGTIIFVFISGFLFYHLNKETFSYPGYLKSRFLKIILPYLIISIPAIVYKLFFNQLEKVWWMTPSFASKTIPEKILIMIETGRHIGPFWFIPMISLIYLISPFTITFSRTRAFLYLAPLIIMWGMFTFQYGYRSNVGLSFIYFFPVYLFGIWIYRMRDVLEAHATAVLISAFVIWIGFTILELSNVINFDDNISLRELNFAVFKFNVFKLKMHFLTIFLYMVFLRFFDRPLPVAGKLGAFSFGIYFCHPYIIKFLDVLQEKKFFTLGPFNLLKYVIALVLVVGICFGVVTIMRKVFGAKSRFIIGT